MSGIKENLNENLIIKFKKKIIQIAYEKQEGHVPSCFSCIEILNVLYGSILKYDDTFILSKGHAALALYVVMNHYKELQHEKLDMYAQNNGISAHPSIYVDGIISNTGSLGHGICHATGVALYNKINDKHGHVYCMVGDGECQEGVVWEVFATIARMDLPLTIIIDLNEKDRLSIEQITMLDKLFEFNSIKIFGHIESIIKDSLLHKYKLIIAQTIKGFGIDEMMSNPSMWHHRKISKSDYNRFIEELEDFSYEK